LLLLNRAAGSQVEELSSAKAELAANLEQAAAEKDKLVPQLEQARWQNRQLEKKLEEAAAAKTHAEQVRTRMARM
jgi:chromosome segregation ATPase